MGYKSPARTNSAQHSSRTKTNIHIDKMGYKSPARTNSAQYTNKEQTTIKSWLTPLSRARFRSLLEEFAPGRDRDTKLTAVLCVVVDAFVVSALLLLMYLVFLLSLAVRPIVDRTSARPLPVTSALTGQTWPEESHRPRHSRRNTSEGSTGLAWLVVFAAPHCFCHWMGKGVAV